MYLLLLIGHMTLAVTATTPGLTTQDLQTHISQSDAVTKGHVSASSNHTAATTGAQGAPVIHTDAVTKGHVSASSNHTAATTGAQGAPVIHTVAVTATTPGLTTQDLQTHISQSDAVTKGHADAVTKGHAATTGAQVAPVIHTVHQTSETQTHVAAHQGHVSPTELPTTKVPIDHKVSVHHSTYVSHSDSIRRHSTVTKKELPSTLSKTQASQVIMGSESVPVLNMDIIDKIHHFTCSWDLGPQDTHYELVQRDTMVENITVHGKEAAVFKYNIPQGPTELYCRVRTPSGEMVISKPMRIMGDTTEGEGKAQDKTKTDMEEKDASPKFLISLNKILTSVTQPVQDLNAVVIGVCGPVTLVVLLVVFVTHFRNRRERKVELTALSSAA